MGAKHIIFAVLVSILVAFCVKQTEWAATTSSNSSVSTIKLNNTKLDDSYCCCSAEAIDGATKNTLGILYRITASPYFRYYKVNSEKQCPYWAVALLCTGGENACQVCTCDENSIPEALRVPTDMSDVCIPGQGVAQWVPHPPNIDEWGKWMNTEDDAEYVDLLQNPEGNTGYSGPLAMKVWQSIYKENCLGAPQQGDQCKEINVLHTLLSGLHSSINIHVCTNFYKDPEHTSPQRNAGIYNNRNISFFPNCEMYSKRVAPFPQFLENLYVLYQFTLRALTKSKELFTSELDQFNSGPHGTATVEDIQLKQDVKELFDSQLLCSKTFDEAVFLESPRGRQLVPEMKRMLLNVTRLMDCVTCQKCRIWGKLETKGILTALQIVTHTESSGPLSLDRAEKVTLINLARQLAFSVFNAQRLGRDCDQDSTQK